jgi:acyl-CoA synthetase (NDP forming)
MVAAGVAPLQGFADGVAAYAGAVGYGERRAADIDVEGLKLPPLPAMPRDARPLDEAAGKELLAAAGVVVPEGRVVAGGDAPDAAALIGFPVVVKLVSDKLPHKTEAGAVKVGLASREEVTRGVEDIRRSVRRHDASALTDRFLVERMVEGAVAELLVGVRRDPQFGLALTIASGGVLVELIRDAQTLLLPTERARVDAAIGKLKVARLLDGYRGRPPGDRASLVATIMALVSFAEDNASTFAEADINPLMVLAEGAIAVDVLLSLGSAV